MAIFYEWYCTETIDGKRRRRKLRWRMTIPDLMEHGLRPQHMGKIFEMVPNSGEDRGESTGPYVGWGQFVPIGPGAPNHDE